jgi:anti-anti-sigma factor
VKFNYKCKDGALWVYLAGEMDHHSAKSARENTDRVIEKEHPQMLFIDTSGITFCDSSGLGFVMGRYKRMKELGGDTVLVSPSAAVSKMILLSGMDKLVRVEVKDK